MPHHFRPGEQVFWWKRVSGGEYPYRAEVIAIGKKRIKIAADDVEDGIDRVIRHVPPERLQPVGAYYVKATGQGPADGPEQVESWGRFTRYLEIGEDLRAFRQVDVFGNKNLLSYDRSHWVDDFGMLADGRLNRTCKQGPWGRSREIAADEFERIWTAARSSPIWQQQVATAQMARLAKLGVIPIWLLQGWRPGGAKG
jgi:hypothetical protein